MKRALKSIPRFKWHGEVPLPGPIVLGHEGIGVIEELGHGTTSDFAGLGRSPYVFGHLNHET
jgi:hypothetical protein